MTAPTATRPASEFDPLALLEAVREVAEASGAEEAATLSTRAWDNARQRCPRYAHAPAARRICEHLGLPWDKVRELAFITADRARSIALGHALNQQQGDWLTPEYSDFALKLVAHRLDVPTLTPGEYRSQRTTLLAGDRTGLLRLPTEHQIEALAGTWDRALAHAGLRARQGLGGQRSRSAPASILEVLDRCFEHHGTEATSKELEVFARANGIPFPRRERGRPWNDYLREWKESRRARGLDVPDGPPPTRLRPDYARDVGAALPGERRKTTWANRDDVINWVARYLNSRSRGQSATQRSYNAWARQQAGAPWSGAFDQHGGWDAVRDAARRRLGQERA